MQVAAMNPTYISRNDISAEELAKLQEITVDAALNDPASLPKPILNKLIDKAMNSSAWSDEDKAIYEEKKSNMNYLFNFLSKEAAAALAELAMADKDAIVSDKIFKGLADGRVSKQLKEICLLDQTYVKAEDGKQTEMCIRDRTKVLGEALELLTEKEKKVVTLYYYEDLTLKEISNILEVSESRVSQLHTRALQKMKTKMGDYMGLL